MARTKKNSQSIAERFWACVPDRPADGCWLWAGYRARGRTDRYGRLGIGKRPEGAHRISWELHNGPIPPGLQVLHRCDNPPCVNPAHLFLGSQQDNINDREAKGRGNRPRNTLGRFSGVAPDVC